jgi:hypothetical protein
LEYYWKDLDAEVDSHSVAEGVGYHSVAGMGDVAGTDCRKGTNHNSTDQKEASVDYPAGNQYVDECYYQKSVPEAFSSWQQGMVSSQQYDKSEMCVVIYLTPMKRVHSWRVMESSLRSHVYIERKASHASCGWKSKSIQW